MDLLDGYTKENLLSAELEYDTKREVFLVVLWFGDDKLRRAVESKPYEYLDQATDRYHIVLYKINFKW